MEPLIKHRPPESASQPARQEAVVVIDKRTEYARILPVLGRILYGQYELWEGRKHTKKVVGIEARIASVEAFQSDVREVDTRGGRSFELTVDEAELVAQTLMERADWDGCSHRDEMQRRAVIGMELWAALGWIYQNTPPDLHAATST